MLRRSFLSLLNFLGLASIARGANAALDYDQFIHLDAEDLAETGMKKAYDELAPTLKKYVASPAPMKESIDNDAPSYSVECLGRKYFIYGGKDQDRSWTNAAYAFFDIVNRQLEKAPVRFYAFYGGNDFGGMFLTPAAAAAAQKSLPKKEQPYLPTTEGTSMAGSTP